MRKLVKQKPVGPVVKLAATILCATIAYWIVAIAFIVAVGNMFPPRACGNLFMIGECVVEAKLRFAVGLICSFVLYSLAFWILMRRRKRAAF